ncbi:ATP-binding cassette domain-containing protein [Isoptericola cucumis]|uniref:ABC transporter n=1 Tax=Isoptericola cucumis TaxID=1776856 RepID=A0ABQ2B188_9MICO|nr:ATP-binding cassette domain-containing protein [Isoptericola cucumis]GGI05449.1 ABC transporter [Isoptericola cucumis]
MIRTRGLTKDFVVSRHETVHAVRGIDLDVEAGELVAVLGPNGAGKTTTMRMLTTLLAPTSGTAHVAGHDVTTAPHRVRAAIGYVGQGNGAASVQQVRDELVLQGRVHGLDRRAAEYRADELLEALDLAPLARRKVDSLSGGQRRRLDVALGLVQAPPLLFLDEPSTGLDPHNRANLWEHVLRLRTRSAESSGPPTTIVLTTHYLDEADTMAERVVVVDHGEVIADDTADALKADLAGDHVALQAAPEHLAVLAQIAERDAGTREVAVDVTADHDGAGDAGPDRLSTGVVSVRSTDGTRAVPGLLRAADAAGVDVLGVQVSRPTLDDVFLALTGRSLRETALDPSSGRTPDLTKEVAR